MKSLSKSQIWRVWVLPMVAALVVTAVLIIERLQVDWTADCSLNGRVACDKDMFVNIFAWFPTAFIFAIFHIAGATCLTPTSFPKWNWGGRGVRIVAYAALHLFPTPGFYLFFAGVAGGLIISLTVIGLVVAPFVGILTAGFLGGGILGLFAGPPIMSLEMSQWKKLLLGYGVGGAVSAIILTLGQVVFDPAFVFLAGNNVPWLTAFGALATVFFTGAIMGWAGLKAHCWAGLVPTPSPYIRSAMVPTAILAIVLILPVQLMVLNNQTVFTPGGGPFAQIAAAFRGYKPAIASSLSLDGLIYKGQRGLILKRSKSGRDRVEYKTINAGTPTEANVGATVVDNFDQWSLADPKNPPEEEIIVTADRSTLQETLDCKFDQESGEDLCLWSGRSSAGYSEKPQTIAYQEDGFVFASDTPNAALAISYDSKTIGDEDARKWGRIYCRLNLVSVTSAKFSVIQIIPCNANWKAEARRVRAYVEELFEQHSPDNNSGQSSLN